MNSSLEWPVKQVKERRREREHSPLDKQTDSSLHHQVWKDARSWKERKWGNSPFTFFALSLPFLSLLFLLSLSHSVHLIHALCLERVIRHASTDRRLLFSSHLFYNQCPWEGLANAHSWLFSSSSSPSLYPSPILSLSPCGAGESSHLSI